MHTPALSYVRHPVVFTGSEVEYRRLWLRNALLLVMTLGLSLPWALVSKARYFYGHTRVAGHALAYHANPFHLFLGNLVGSVVLNGIYYGISKTGPFAAVGFGAMQILMGILTPLMLHGLLEFKLTHTSWRGQRLGLSAKPVDAFKALALPTLIYLASGVLIVWAVMVGRAPRIEPALWLGAIGTAGLCVGLPLMYWRYKRYQHRHAVLGAIANEHEAAERHVRHELLACLLAAGMALVALFAIVLPLGLWLAGLVGLDSGIMDRLANGLPAKGRTADLAMILAVLVPSLFIGTALIMALPYPYLSAQLQNQLWPRTGHQQLRFESAVPLDDLLKLTGRNWLLIVCTLGFHYPHAAISEARLRLQAVAVLLPGKASADEEPAHVG